MVTSADDYAELTVLFRAGLAGDSASYTLFLERLTPLLTRIVTRKLGQREVEDVVQDILISIHKARHTYDGERSIVPWIASIAKFRITDHLRKYYSQRRNKTVDIVELADFLPDVTNEGESSEYIDELLDGVPQNHRQILTLMHVEGYTAKEVGKQLGMNESAVKVAAHRAIKKIRKSWGA